LLKVALITGASSGIGAAIARELARRGYALVLAARSVGALERLAAELSRAGAPALPVPTDVTRPADIERLVRVALARFERIDVLVNNAGIGETRRAPHGAAADLTLHTNLLAPIQLTRAVVPTMLSQRSGHIINIASVAAHVGIPGSAGYAASKHGLRGYSEALRRELAPYGISVSVISPGLIRTAMTKRHRLPMPGPALVARAVARLLRHPRHEVVVPGFYRLLIWLNRLLPWLIDWTIARFYRR
jgi:short-subunit dehydrogenase